MNLKLKLLISLFQILIDIQIMDGDRVLLTFRLFQYSVIDGKDELVDKHESCYKALVQTIQGKGDKEISNSLNMEAMESHKNICTGLHFD
jgi:hypothetical protein